MTALPTVTIKQGATLQLLIQVSNDDGTACDLTGVAIAAQVRDQYLAPIGALGFVQTGAVGQLSVEQDTTLWPVGTLRSDIKLTRGTVVLKSASFAICVQAAMTR